MSTRPDAQEEVDGADPWTVVDRLVHLFRLNRSDETGLIKAVCAQAVAVIPGVRSAEVILAGGRDRLEVIAITADELRSLATLQQRTGSGPCLTAATTQKVVRIDDLTHDQRWSRYAARAVELGVSSMLCLPLRIDGESFGTLSLFAARPHAIDASTEPIAQVMAVLAASTLGEFRARTNLRIALDTRDLIGQAKGILMERLRINADDAFAVLVTQSQRTNTKLRTVAHMVVETGALDPS